METLDCKGARHDCTPLCFHFLTFMLLLPQIHQFIKTCSHEARLAASKIAGAFINRRFDDAKKGRDLQLSKKQSTQAEALAAHQRQVDALEVGREHAGQFDVFENEWQEQFKKLEKFKKKNGHMRVPKRNVLYSDLFLSISSEKTTRGSFGKERGH